MGGLLSLKTPQEYEEGLSWWERVEDRLGSYMLLKCLGEPTRDLLKQAAARAMPMFAARKAGPPWRRWP